MFNLEEPLEDQRQHYLPQQLKDKLVIVTIHDACPAFSTKIFNCGKAGHEMKWAKHRKNSKIHFFSPPKCSCSVGVDEAVEALLLDQRLPSPTIGLIRVFAAVADWVAWAATSRRELIVFFSHAGREESLLEIEFLFIEYA